MGSHTFEKIAEILDDVHAKFGLHNDKLVATVSDNGANFLKAFRGDALFRRFKKYFDFSTKEAKGAIVATFTLP